NSHRRVLAWFAGRWRNHQHKRAEKPHSKFSRCEALNGPATRPKTPLAVENSVGKLAALPCGAPNASTGKRAWRTPIPHLVPVRPQGRAGTLCFNLSIAPMLRKLRLPNFRACLRLPTVLGIHVN